MKIESFKPIIDKDSRILILGSIPGTISLDKNEYYGNQRNQFWKIIYFVFNFDMQENYEDRIKFLLQNKIALWDVIGTCERQGSLDSKIKNPILNDFENLFKEYPNIRHILLNGTKAYEIFNKKIDKNIVEDKILYKMKSTSPANAIKFEDKLNDWKILRQI